LISFYSFTAFYLLLIAVIVIIRLITKRKINTVRKAEELQNPASNPQIINNQIILTTKNKFQLSNIDCLVDFVLWNILNKV